jgi:hypothetical protein
MKYLFLLFFIAVSNQEINKELLIGSWSCVSRDKYSPQYILSFNPDSTFIQIIYLDQSFDQDSLIFYGDYKIIDENLIFNFEGSEKKDTYKIKKLTSNKLILNFMYISNDKKKEKTSKFKFRKVTSHTQ